jgi:hypothetical protein
MVQNRTVRYRMLFHSAFLLHPSADSCRVFVVERERTLVVIGLHRPMASP